MVFCPLQSVDGGRGPHSQLYNLHNSLVMGKAVSVTSNSHQLNSPKHGAPIYCFQTGHLDSHETHLSTWEHSSIWEHHKMHTHTIKQPDSLLANFSHRPRWHPCMFDLTQAARHSLSIFSVQVFSWLAVRFAGHCLIHLKPDPFLVKVLQFTIKHVVHTHIQGCIIVFAAWEPKLCAWKFA